MAGHRSPLAEEKSTLLHESESALLQQAVRLGRLNAAVTHSVQWIQVGEGGGNGEFIAGPFQPSSHAIASTIDDQLLAPYAKSLVGLEELILKRDSQYVGGQNVVPLSLVVTKAVHQWQKQFRYALGLLDFLLKTLDGKCRPCVEVMDRLDRDTKSIGYESVRLLAEKCLVVCQRTWLQQVSSWVLYGRLPSQDQSDFMIGCEGNRYFIRPALVPKSIVSTGQAIQDLFSIGNSLNQLQRAEKNSHHQKLLLEHAESLLKSTSLPIEPTHLSRVLSAIKRSVYKNVVATVLPVADVLRFFSLLRNISLIGSADFALKLIEFNQVNNNNKTLRPHEYFENSLASYYEDSGERDLSELALNTFQYVQVKESHQVVHEDKFDDLLVGVRAKLLLKLEWPYSILLSSSGDSERYSFLFSYLAALRKASEQVSNLWRMRRNSETPQWVWKTAQQAKLFLDVMWGYIQSSIISASFTQLVEAECTRQLRAQDTEGVDIQKIISKHKEYLGEVCRMLFIDDASLRKMMRKVIIHTFAFTSVVSSSREEQDRLISVSNDLTASIKSVVEYVEAAHEHDRRISLLLLKVESLV
ncbi:hypothetical protein TRVA0_012S01904 [Trichomonascus vanleenenianus]|uniref:uncharacterized protein n=1 Tax=Trichomonascus vanleenenianus TaxID=2268995 RepID=UPI003ECBA684